VCTLIAKKCVKNADCNISSGRLQHQFGVIAKYVLMPVAKKISDDDQITDIAKKR